MDNSPASLSSPSASLMEMALYRAQLYAAAAEAFANEPDVPTLQALVAVSADGQGQPGAYASEGRLLEYLGSLDDSDYEGLRKRIATEYAELFVGPRPPLAPLYESVYVGAVRRLNTDVTMQVRKFYDQCGLVAVKRNTVPNDHIGLELEFMSQLCTREAEAPEEAEALRATELEFLNVHLGSWVDAFASRVSAAYCADYYDAWARFVQAFVAEDRAYLEHV